MRGPFKRRWLLGLIPAVAVAGWFAPRAFAGWGGGHRMCGGHGPHGFPDEDGLAFAKKRAAYVLDELKATDQQKASINQILDDNMPTFSALQEEKGKIHNEMQAAAETGDFSELEGIRKRGIDLADRATQQGLGVMKQVSDVLTPVQRQEVIKHFRNRWE